MEWPSRRRLLVTWLVVAVALAAVTSIIRRGASRLDDPDPARQRPGVLVAASSATLAPTVLRRALPAGGVVFFEREGRAGELCELLAGRSLRSPAVVVAAGGAPRACAGLALAPSGDIASAVGLAQPSDGGAPVGYALLDGAGRVRYSTLDPAAADHLPEVETMLRAIG